MKKRLSMFLILAVLAGVLSGCGRSIRTFLGQPAKVALIAQQRRDTAGLALEAGAGRAAAELEVQLVNLSPEEADSTLQAQQIRQAVAEDCEAIVISYRQSAEVSEALQEAAQAGLALVYVDTAPGTVDRTIYATDHRAAGRRAAELMLEMLETRRIRKGVVGIIGVNQKDAAALQRESGFREAIDQRGFAIAQTRYDAKNPVRARNIAEDLITQNDVSAIFSLSELSTAAAGSVVRDLDCGTIVVGVGQDQQIQALMAEGYVRATLLQDYDAMGYDALKAAVDILDGKPAAAGLTDTGVKLLESQVPLLRASDLRLAFIATDQQEPYWDELEAGAQKAALELGCDVVDLSPQTPDRAEQVRQIQHAVEDGYFGIISASDSFSAVDAALHEARDMGLKVVCVDMSAHQEADAAVEEDYLEAGRMAARAVLEDLLSRNLKKGKIGILGIDKEDQPALQREEGFREIFEGTDYQLLDTQYTEDDAATADDAAMRLANNGVKAIFSCGEGATLGAAYGIQSTGQKVILVGYGRLSEVGFLLEEDMAQGILAPRPDSTGYDAVKTACAMILDQESEDNAGDPGVVLQRKE